MSSPVVPGPTSSSRGPAATGSRPAAATATIDDDDAAPGADALDAGPGVDPLAFVGRNDPAYADLGTQTRTTGTS